MHHHQCLKTDFFYPRGNKNTSPKIVWIYKYSSDLGKHHSSQCVSGYKGTIAHTACRLQRTDKYILYKVMRNQIPNICLGPIHITLWRCRPNQTWYLGKGIPTYTVAQPLETIGQMQSLLDYLVCQSIHQDVFFNVSQHILCHNHCKLQGKCIFWTISVPQYTLGCPLQGILTDIGDGAPKHDVDRAPAEQIT